MTDYFKALELLLELIGFHPRRPDPDESLIEALRRAGWRPFRIERVA